MQRAAQRWGIADRVRFEGWLPRDVLLSRLATAGALLHPALHEEAGLCVAEALALGTPAVCLAHGGPAEIVRQWPDTPSAAVPIADRETTARRLADAIDRFLDNPPPVCAVPRASATSFEQELLSAYDAAARMSIAACEAGPESGRFHEASHSCSPIPLEHSRREFWCMPSEDEFPASFNPALRSRCKCRAYAGSSPNGVRTLNPCAAGRCGTPSRENLQQRRQRHIRRGGCISIPSGTSSGQALSA